MKRYSKKLQKNAYSYEISKQHLNLNLKIALMKQIHTTGEDDTGYGPVSHWGGFRVANHTVRSCTDEGIAGECKTGQHWAPFTTPVKKFKSPLLTFWQKFGLAWMLTHHSVNYTITLENSLATAGKA